LYFEVVGTQKVATMFDTMEDYGSEIVIKAGRKGLTIHAVDIDSTNIVHVFWAAGGFKTYRCSNDFAININPSTVNRCLKMAQKEDLVTMEIKSKQTGPVLEVAFRSAAKSGGEKGTEGLKENTYQVAIRDVDNEDMNQEMLPMFTEDSIKFSLDASEFQNMFDEASQFGDHVNIHFTPTAVYADSRCSKFSWSRALITQAGFLTKSDEGKKERLQKKVDQSIKKEKEVYADILEKFHKKFPYFLEGFSNDAEEWEDELVAAADRYWEDNPKDYEEFVLDQILKTEFTAAVAEWRLENKMKIPPMESVEDKEKREKEEMEMPGYPDIESFEVNWKSENIIKLLNQEKIVRFRQEAKKFIEPLFEKNNARKELIRKKGDVEEELGFGQKKFCGLENLGKVTNKKGYVMNIYNASKIKAMADRAYEFTKGILVMEMQAGMPMHVKMDLWNQKNAGTAQLYLAPRSSENKGDSDSNSAMSGSDSDAEMKDVESE